MNYRCWRALSCTSRTCSSGLLDCLWFGAEGRPGSGKRGSASRGEPSTKAAAGTESKGCLREHSARELAKGALLLPHHWTVPLFFISSLHLPRSHGLQAKSGACATLWPGRCDNCVALTASRDLPFAPLSLRHTKNVMARMGEISIVEGQTEPVC